MEDQGQPVKIVGTLPLPTGGATSEKQTELAALVGEVQATPTANTLLRRLKDLLTGISLAAGAELIGKVIAHLETGTLYNGTVALTPKWAFANIAASQTDSSLVALVASKKIRVLAAFAIAGGTATDVTFQSNAVAISAKLAAGSNSGAVLGFNPLGWFQTVAGEALKVTTGAGSTVGIQVLYVEV